MGAGESHEFAPEVCRQTGWVVVRSDQENDEISIDGKKVGASTDAQRPLRVGEHEVRVEKKGYEPWEGVVSVVPGQVLGLRPHLAAARGARRPPEKQQKRPRPQQEQRAGKDETELAELEGWHQKAKEWLLARYDDDRSGELDTRKEVEEVPCEQWLGLEQSHDASGLGLPLISFYGFDGDRWQDGRLGVDSSVRDIAYKRMKECGLR